MAYRLSETPKRSVYETGQRAYLRPELPDEGDLRRLLLRPDLRKIAGQRDASKIIKKIPPQALLMALKSQGLSDSLDILPMLSQDQFIRICDYDVWRDERLAPGQLFQWLSLFREISPAQMLRRFRQLEEECQLAVLSPYITVFTQDDYERMSEEQQDQLHSFPGNALYYHIRSGDPVIQKGIMDLLEAAMAGDMNYAMSLVAHSGYAVPNENEHLLAQFRKARLEEDGFVSYEESLQCFLPEEVPLPEQKPESSHSSPALSEESRVSFLVTCLEKAAALCADDQINRLQISFLQLANSLCAITRTEPGDLAGLRDTLLHAQGMVSLALDFLSNGDPEAGAQRLLENHPRNLFRTGIGLVHQLRVRVLNSLEQAGLPDIRKLRDSYSAMKYGKALDCLDRYAETLLTSEQTEILKGLFNRFPLRPDHHINYRDEKALRLSFTPVRGIQDFRILTGAIETIVALLRLRTLSPDQELSLHLDTALNRGMARAMLQKTFSSRTLTPEEAGDFRQADAQTLREGKELFLKAVSLRLAEITPWLRHPSGSEKIEAVDSFLSRSAFPETAAGEVAELCDRLTESVRHGGFETLTNGMVIRPVSHESTTDTSEGSYL